MIKIETFPPAPVKERPIAIIGAGGIVGDAHLPAYQKAGFEVKAIYDLDHQKALKLQRQFEVGTTCKHLGELLRLGTDEDCVFDLAVPASAILKVLPHLPDACFRPSVFE